MNIRLSKVNHNNLSDFEVHCNKNGFQTVSAPHRIWSNNDLKMLCIWLEVIIPKPFQGWTLKCHLTPSVMLTPHNLQHYFPLPSFKGKGGKGERKRESHNNYTSVKIDILLLNSLIKVYQTFIYKDCWVREWTQTKSWMESNLPFEAGWH